MKIKLDSFKGDNLIQIDQKETIELPSDLNVEHKYAECAVKGVLEKNGEEYMLHLSVSLDIEFKCDMCLAPVTDNVYFDISEKFSTILSEDDEENEIWSVKNNEIDILAHIKRNMIVNMPMKILCKSDCKGLCLKCGKNFNDGDCKCDKKVYDPRFESLKSLFTDKEV